MVEGKSNTCSNEKVDTVEDTQSVNMQRGKITKERERVCQLDAGD